MQRGWVCRWPVPRSINQGLVGKSREHARWFSEGVGSACKKENGISLLYWILYKLFLREATRWPTQPVEKTSCKMGYWVSPVSPSPGLVKLLTLSNQQAWGSTPWPDCLTGLTLSFVVSTTLFLHHYVDCVEYPYQCTLRLWYLETPMPLCNGRVRRH